MSSSLLILPQHDESMIHRTGEKYQLHTPCFDIKDETENMSDQDKIEATKRSLHKKNVYTYELYPISQPLSLEGKMEFPVRPYHTYKFKNNTYRHSLRQTLALAGHHHVPDLMTQLMFNMEEVLDLATQYNSEHILITYATAVCMQWYFAVNDRWYAPGQDRYFFIACIFPAHDFASAVELTGSDVKDYLTGRSKQNFNTSLFAALTYLKDIDPRAKKLLENLPQSLYNYVDHKWNKNWLQALTCTRFKDVYVDNIAEASNNNILSRVTKFYPAPKKLKIRCIELSYTPTANTNLYPLFVSHCWLRPDTWILKLPFIPYKLGSTLEEIHKATKSHNDILAQLAAFMPIGQIDSELEVKCRQVMKTFVEAASDYDDKWTHEREHFGITPVRPVPLHVLEHTCYVDDDVLYLTIPELVLNNPGQFPRTLDTVMYDGEHWVQHLDGDRKCHSLVDVFASAALKLTSASVERELNKALRYPSMRDDLFRNMCELSIEILNLPGIESKENFSTVNVLRHAGRQHVSDLSSSENNAKIRKIMAILFERDLFQHGIIKYDTLADMQLEMIKMDLSDATMIANIVAVLFDLNKSPVLRQQIENSFYSEFALRNKAFSDAIIAAFGTMQRSMDTPVLSPSANAARKRKRIQIKQEADIVAVDSQSSGDDASDYSAQ
jgi:hypothetical protein